MIIKNIKLLLCVTDWSCLDNIGIEDLYDKFVDIIHEYTNIYAVLKLFLSQLNELYGNRG